MSESNTNNNRWVNMNEITLDGCVDPKADVQSTSSDSLVDEESSTSDDQALDRAISAKSNKISPQSASEASISPHARTDPIVCHCNCTRIPKSSLADDKDIVRLTSSNYCLASSPESQVLVSENGPRSNNLRALNDLEPWSVPRTFGFESPTDIQNWFREYQSDEDTASEEGHFGYTLTNSDTAGTRDRRPSEGESSDQQDLSDTE
ncbi:uncharacterized protein PAC_07565 [Phialocephala subalpina]|uniref:Uncharacterized protein n=1 Tax=Phialocephala subalpina TaxID=576137 RepID=A0A1L7WY23_9HELO|nr:uncharacterized protein PAC_07565 [Phialocephala subalpina]